MPGPLPNSSNVCTHTPNPPSHSRKQTNMCNTVKRAHTENNTKFAEGNSPCPLVHFSRTSSSSSPTPPPRIRAQDDSGHQLADPSSSSLPCTMLPIHHNAPKNRQCIREEFTPIARTRFTPKRGNHRNSRRLTLQSSSSCGDADIQNCSLPTLTLPPMHRQPANLYKPHQSQQQLSSSPFLHLLPARALPQPLLVRAITVSSSHERTNECQNF